MNSLTKKRFLISLLLCLWPIFLGGCSYFLPPKDDKTLFMKKILKESSLPQIHYTASLQVEGDKSLTEYFSSFPRSLSSQTLPPTSTNALRFQAESDLKLLRKALKNKGYLKGQVRYEKTMKKGLPHLHFIITTGLRYKISGLSITIDQSPDTPLPLWVEKARRVINIPEGSPVDLDEVLQSAQRLIRYFKTKGYLNVEVQEPQGQIHDEGNSLHLYYHISLRGKKFLGPLCVSGLEKVDESFVRNRLRLPQGRLYDIHRLEQAEREILNTELFSSITLTPNPPPEEHQENGTPKKIPLKLSVKEAPFRSVGLGIRYATQEGLGGKIYWQHRNLWGKGERLTLKAEGSLQQLDAFIQFSKPDIIWVDFSLESKLSYIIANTKAFTGKIYEAYGGAKHRYSNTFSYQVGLSYEHSHLKQEVHQKKSFFGAPLLFSMDHTNDALNPYKGWKGRLDLIPYWGNLGSKGHFTKISSKASTYLQLIKKDKMVIAFWGKGGIIASSTLGTIPLNKRFYGGGLGSVRGYGYQKLGPISVQGRPAGGQGLIEGGIEPRFRIGDNLGFSVFFEGGKVYHRGKLSEAIKTNISSKSRRTKASTLLFGYGAGLKYYTAIGPLRLDVGFPIKRRKFNNKYYDAPFQIYISLGQSF